MKTILTVIGTRPEAIKLAPILQCLGRHPFFHSSICMTGQHTSLVEPFISEFDLEVDYRINNLPNAQIPLHKCASHILSEFGDLLEKTQPDLIVVQGDTTTTFSAALSAFYQQIPIAHIEAGLRSGNIFSPWPEEAHRCFVDKITDYFFAPTIEARDNLLAEGIPQDQIWVVGNTSIDALRITRDKVTKLHNTSTKRKILVTLHRRENQEQPLDVLCRTIDKLIHLFPDIEVDCMLHPTPQVYNKMTEMLGSLERVTLHPPLSHTAFVRLMEECLLLITDSGGLQEEASFLGKPVFIFRDTTERPEGIQVGAARLVGTSETAILDSCKELLGNQDQLEAMSKVHTSYGDGFSAERIVSILEASILDQAA